MTSASAMGPSAWPCVCAPSLTAALFYLGERLNAYVPYKSATIGNVLIYMRGERTLQSKADRLVPILLILGALLTAADIAWTFTLAPLVQGAALSEPTVIAGQVVTTKLLLSQKIFYLHVPVAIASFAIMFFVAYYGVRFLMTKDRKYDLRSQTAAQVTLVFIIATMVSGDLWTRFEWGVWWVWEPRLTTYFILMLLVIGYFILRNAIEDPERRARFCAVFGIVAFIDAPISFLITRMVPSSIHPVVFRTDSGLPPMMLIPFLLGLFGMLMIGFALYRYALRVHTDALVVDELKEQLEEMDVRSTRVAADDALARLRAAASSVAPAAADAAAPAVTDASPAAPAVTDAVADASPAAPVASSDSMAAAFDSASATANSAHPASLEE